MRWFTVDVARRGLPTEASIAEGHMLALCLGHYLGAWSDALLLFQKVASGYEWVMGTNSQHTMAAKTQVVVRAVHGPNHSYTQQWLSILHQWEARA